MNAEDFLKTKGIGKPTIKAVRLPHKYKNIELELIPLMEEYAKLKLLGIGGVMPRISHFVSEIGQKYPANDEAVLFEIQDGYLRFYEIGYDFERIYLTPVYVA